MKGMVHVTTTRENSLFLETLVMIMYDFTCKDYFFIREYNIQIWNIMILKL